MSETWSERCLKHEALYTRDESAMCPICEVHSLRAQLAAKGREPVPMREALLEIRVALEFNRTALALRKANDALAAAPAEETPRMEDESGTEAGIDGGSAAGNRP